jgi:DNA repair protein RadC
MVSIPHGLSDAALEDFLLAGARAMPVSGTLGCSDLVPRYAAAPERRAAALAGLLDCAHEIFKRRALRALLSCDFLFSPMQVKDCLQTYFARHEAEAFAVMFLNVQHQVIVVEEMFRGTLTQTSVYPREIVKRALALNAASVVFAHNHPSGQAEPSRADEFLTATLKQALSLVDIRVLDHIVVGKTVCVSMAERGLL